MPQWCWVTLRMDRSRWTCRSTAPCVVESLNWLEGSEQAGRGKMKDSVWLLTAKVWCGSLAQQARCGGLQVVLTFVQECGVRCCLPSAPRPLRLAARRLTCVPSNRCVQELLMFSSWCSFRSGMQVFEQRTQPPLLFKHNMSRLHCPVARSDFDDASGLKVTLPPKIDNSDETRAPRADEGKVSWTHLRNDKSGRRQPSVDSPSGANLAPTSSSIAIALYALCSADRSNHSVVAFTHVARQPKHMPQSARPAPNA